MFWPRVVQNTIVVATQRVAGQLLCIGLETGRAFRPSFVGSAAKSSTMVRRKPKKSYDSIPQPETLRTSRTTLPCDLWHRRTAVSMDCATTLICRRLRR